MANLREKGNVMRKNLINEGDNNGISNGSGLASGHKINTALKWVGGKRQLLPHLIKNFPKTYNSFIDPFMGALSVPLYFRPKKALLSDTNEELVMTHVAIRDRVGEVIKKLNTHIDGKDYFNAIRSKSWQEMDPVSIAARMIYLNKACFNGLYRVNRKGHFNASYATPQKNGRRICNSAQLIRLSDALKRYEIKCYDFRDALRQAKPGDVVFLDPPYFGTYTSYTAAKFIKDDQEALASEFKRLVKLGCYVIACNSNDQYIHDLYSDYAIEAVNVRRNINCDKHGRTGTEVIISSQNKIPANDDV